MARNVSFHEDFLSLPRRLPARKSLGQHFLFDPNLTGKIARFALTKAQGMILEIGAGQGDLTHALLRGGAKKVIAIEIDSRFLPILNKLAADYPDLLTVLCDDARKIALATIANNFWIAANLPYRYASQLLVDWLSVEDWPPWWRGATILLQKEMAQRLTAAPGGKDYGRLSILAQWRAQPRILFNIHPRAFTPPPCVLSSLVEITPSRPSGACRACDLAEVTRHAFGARRKMLRSSLAKLGVAVEILLAGTKCTDCQRAQTVTIDQFCQIARNLAQARGQ